MAKQSRRKQGRRWLESPCTPASLVPTELTDNTARLWNAPKKEVTLACCRWTWGLTVAARSLLGVEGSGVENLRCCFWPDTGVPLALADEGVGVLLAPELARRWLLVDRRLAGVLELLDVDACGRAGVPCRATPGWADTGADGQ